MKNWTAAGASQSVRADWEEGGKFKQHFPQEASYRHSLAEKTGALNRDKLEEYMDKFVVPPAPAKP